MIGKALPHLLLLTLDYTARNEYVLAHLDLVDQIARRQHRRTPPSIDLDDLVQAGRLGLIRAAARYTPDRNVEFGAYARKAIEGEMRELSRGKHLANGQCERLPDTLVGPSQIAAIHCKLTLVAILKRVPPADQRLMTDYYATEARGRCPQLVVAAVERARLAA